MRTARDNAFREPPLVWMNVVSATGGGGSFIPYCPPLTEYEPWVLSAVIDSAAAIFTISVNRCLSNNIHRPFEKQKGGN